MSQGKTLSFSDLPYFKKKYEEALKKKKKTFLFKNTLVLTSYAKYAIEYLEQMQKSPKVN